MPILEEDRQIIEAAIAMFDMEDSVAIAKLVYETLADARMTKANPQGLSFEATTSLGRLIFDKTPWTTIPKIEEAIRDQAIRLPIIKSCDTIFRTQFTAALPKLPDAEKQVLGHFLGKLDSNELMSLVLLVYETLIQAKFAVDPKLFSGVHPFTKFLQAGWTWEDLKAAKPLVEGICVPLINACHDFLRPALPMIFRTEAAHQTPEEKAAEDAATPAPTEITPEIAATQEAAANAASAAAGEGASDANPFADPAPDTVPDHDTAPAAEPDAPKGLNGAHAASPETLEASPEAPEASEASEALPEATEASEALPEALEASEASPEAPETPEVSKASGGSPEAPEASEVPFEVMPENGARTLSKKERRELRRKQREGAGT
jgi:hypothetical protein